MKTIPSKVILASAGTGKTWSLTTQYLHLLLAGVTPDRILATTFTRKAAGEIFERVLRRLVDAAESDAALKELAGAIEDPGLTQERCLTTLGAFVRAMDRAAICTIDSFFMRLASAFSLDLKMPPGWSIAEEDTLNTLREKAIAQLIDAGDPDSLLKMVRLLLKRRHSSRVLDEVRRTVEDIYHVTEGAPIEAWDAIAPRGHLLQHTQLEKLRQTFADVAVPRTAGGKGKENAGWAKAKEKLRGLMSGNDWQGFLSNGLVEKIVAGEVTYSKVDIPDPWRSVLERLIGHFQALALNIHSDQNRATGDLLQRFEKAYRAQKELHGAYGFEDVPRALAAADACGDLQHLYYRLDGRIDHILLDEFQDTSVTQFRLLEPIIDELVTRADEGRSLFCVGDVKQSLYQWRNAEPELLPSIPRRWETVEQEFLEDSRRSAPVIIGAVNSVFGSLAGNGAFNGKEHDDTNAAAAWAANFRTHDTVKQDLTGYACLRVAPEPTDGERGAQARETLAFAARRVKALLDQDPGLSVGVLVPRRKNIARLIHLLKLLGVEASEESGNTVSDSPAVAAALSLLHLADHPGDTAAQFHVGTSPLGRILGLPYPADEWTVRRVASGIRLGLLEDGYAATLSRWLSQIAADCDARDYARFEQLVELALEFDSRAGLRADEFVELVHKRRVEAPTRAGVRVMTVHASKGLEFDAVVLPELEGRLTGGINPAVLVDRKSVLGDIQAITRYPSDMLQAAHPRLAEIYAKWRRREIGEQLCVLYVAMTRARRHLEMIIHPAPKPDLRLTYAGVLRGALAKPGPAAAEDVLWEVGDAEWAAQSRESKSQPGTPAPPEPIVVRLKRADEKGLRHLARRSPSGLAGAYKVDLASELVLSGTFATDRGQLFHAWFELIEWLDDGTPDQAALLAAAHGLEVGPGLDLPRESAEFKAMLGRPHVRAMLSRAGYAQAWGKDIQLVVQRERPFALRDADPASGQSSLLSGRIDRLVIGLRAGVPVGAEIVDYKTDAAKDTGDAARIAGAYTPQMHAYRRATAAMLGLPPDKVGVKLALVAADLVVDVPA